MQNPLAFSPPFHSVAALLLQHVSTLDGGPKGTAVLHCWSHAISLIVRHALTGVKWFSDTLHVAKEVNDQQLADEWATFLSKDRDGGSSSRSRRDGTLQSRR